MNHHPPLSVATVRALLAKGKEQPVATTNYPSRGQTSVQKLYLTPRGKFFLKRSSEQNHLDCQIRMASGTLAERELWAYRLARHLGLSVPTVWLLDRRTTVQVWFDLPDARQYSTYHGVMQLDDANVFDCALFDWLSGQIDRHDANYLYNFVAGQIILIDSAHAFLQYEGSLPDYLRFSEATHQRTLTRTMRTPLRHRMATLTAHQLHRLVPLPQREERMALQHRLAQAQRVTCTQDLINLYRRNS